MWVLRAAVSLQLTTNGPPPTNECLSGRSAHDSCSLLGRRPLGHRILFPSPAVPSVVAGETHGVTIRHRFDLLVVLSFSQQVEPLRVQSATAGKQLAPLVPSQVRAEGIHGDDEGTAVGLKLPRTRTHTHTGLCITVFVRMRVEDRNFWKN